MTAFQGGGDKNLITMLQFRYSEGVLAQWSNPLTFQSEQLGEVGSMARRTPPHERHDKGLQTQLGLLSALGAEKRNHTFTTK